MAILNTALLFLPAVALLFSIIELGLSGYVVHVTMHRYYFMTLKERVDFLLFNSIWTILVSAFLIFLPLMSARRGVTSKSNTWISPVTLTLNILTMIFWLAGFAALANLFGGFVLTGIIGATLAFAILLWLIFLALMIINILTALGVVQSDRLGYSPMSRRRMLP